MVKHILVFYVSIQLTEAGTELLSVLIITIIIQAYKNTTLIA